jgi:RNA polymerase sigma-70 factor, ECF subfamily
MRKNWLAAAWARWLRAEPLVPDAAFQGASEPYPGHWRQSPELWPAAAVGETGAHAPGSGQQAALDAALADVPDLWRRVVLAHDGAGRDDEQVADECELTVAQVRDILARARAAVRDRLDPTWTGDVG